MTPSRTLFLAATLFVFGGGFLFASAEGHGLPPLVVGVVVGLGALGAHLTEHQPVGLNATQEVCLTSLIREGHTLKAVRRLQSLGDNDVKTAYRYVRRLERREPRHGGRSARGSADQELWWA
jgi:hypothetical protein